MNINNPPKIISIEVLLWKKEILRISDGKGNNPLENQLTDAEKIALSDGADFIEMFGYEYKKMPSTTRVRNHQAIKYTTYILEAQKS